MKTLNLLICILVANVLSAQQFEIYDTFCCSESNDFVVFDDTVYTSSNNSVAKRINGSWQNITPVAFPESGNFYSTNTIKVLADNHIYAAAINSGQTALLRVWNGSNWQNVGTLPSLVQEITDIHFVSPNEIYITAENAYWNQFALRFDGINWINLNLPDPGPMFDNKIHFVSSNEVYISSRGMTMKYNGNTWEDITGGLDNLPHSRWTHVVDENHKYHSGFSQLKNFASGDFVDVGNLYEDEFDTQGIVDFMQVLSPNDIYVSVRRYVGFSDAFFVSHWNGTEWTRLWTYDSSGDADDYLSYFGLSNNHIYAKIINRDLWRYELETMSLETVLNDMAVKIFPNPTDSSIFILSKEPIKTITLFDNVGKKLFQKESINELNLTEYPQGVYFLKITTLNDAFEWKKIIRK